MFFQRFQEKRHTALKSSARNIRYHQHTRSGTKSSRRTKRLFVRSNEGAGMKRYQSLGMGLVAAVLSGLSGCAPLSMGIFTPIPVPPWVTERMEDKYSFKNDSRTPVMPPVRDGFPLPTCDDPPDDAQVIRALPRVARGVPFFYEEFRDDMTVVVEKMIDKIDPPRFFPLIGPAQLHHCHFKCTVYYKETIESGYPFPVKVTRPRVDVVYIDKDHLHLYVGSDPELQKSVTKDLVNY
jgi:hypothetical protein